MRCGQRPCPTLVSPGGGWQLLPLGAQGLQAGPGSAQCDGLNWSATLSVRHAWLASLSLVGWLCEGLWFSAPT